MLSPFRQLLSLMPLGSALPMAALAGVLSSSPGEAQPGTITAHADGLHGCISYGTQPSPDRASYSAGIGFYSAVWSLIDRPLAGLQIGLPGCWILPDNSDNKDRPLAPEGTLARTWKERGPTWDSVFQTVEGGLGYWAGNHFRYEWPKFSMNATPQCYDYEIGSPGWSFFYHGEALPDDRLGIAQLSSRLLIPPDGLPFDERRDGQLLDYAWLALPFTAPTTEDLPTGEQSWTCFLNAASLSGPIAFYVPETWSKIAALFREPFLHGRGLDARPGVVGGGAIEINTVPRLEARDANGTVYSRIPRLHFPADKAGQAVLVQDVTYFAKSALYDGIRRWRDEGVPCSGAFDPAGAWQPALNTSPTRYGQAGRPINGVEAVCGTKVFAGNRWGMEWLANPITRAGEFPEYFRQDGETWTPIMPSAVPGETGLADGEFRIAGEGRAYITPTTGAWTIPGPVTPTTTVALADGSGVTYTWYRFIDQPVFQQYHWDRGRKESLQKLVAQIHAHWGIDRDYMPPPTAGSLVRLDPALVVTPPRGMETGYVPIVVGQRASKRAPQPRRPGTPAPPGRRAARPAPTGGRLRTGLEGITDVAGGHVNSPPLRARSCTAGRAATPEGRPPSFRRTAGPRVPPVHGHSSSDTRWGPQTAAPQKPSGRTERCRARDVAGTAVTDAGAASGSSGRALHGPTGAPPSGSNP